MENCVFFWLIVLVSVFLLEQIHQQISKKEIINWFVWNVFLIQCRIIPRLLKFVLRSPLVHPINVVIKLFLAQINLAFAKNLQFLLFFQACDPLT